jgi:hypothetical protein
MGVLYMETSALSGHNVAALFHKLAECLSNDSNQHLAIVKDSDCEF